MSFNHPDAVIYRLKCLDTKTYYIGSSTDLERRIKKHKNEPHSTNVESIIKTGNYNFKILEECPCNDNKEIFPIEQRYLDRYREKYGELVLNNQNAFTTKEQKREQNRINSKKWVNNNPEKVKLNRAISDAKRKNNPERIKSIKLNSAKRKKNAEFIECPCGGRFKKYSKWSHINRTQIHKDYISKINENKI